MRPQGTKEAPAGPRTKVTVACDGCRKRRVKCSGVMPCSACVANGGTCVFDDKYRGRRRPISRPPPQRVTHNLAPADSASGQALNQQAQSPAGTRLRALLPPVSGSAPSCQDIAGTTLRKATPRPLSDPSQECTAESLLKNPRKWMDGLRNILSNMQKYNLDPSLNVELIAHLLELFFEHRTAIMQQVLPASSLLQTISTGSAFPGLILAVCAYSARFSIHHQVHRWNIEGSHVSDTLAKSARDSMNDYGDNLQAQIDHLKTICILIEYEASISRGGFAWVNLAAARRITQLCLATGKLCPEESKFLGSVNKFLAVTEATHCLGNPKLVPDKSQIIGQSQDCSVELTNPDSWGRLLALLRFLSRIQRHRATGFEWQKSAPWHQHSDFRALHEELETKLLRHRDTPPCPDVGDPGEPHKDDNLNGLVCSLLCHCCDIELNSSFLPISMKGLGRDREYGPDREIIDYPGAPSLFLAERKNRCQSSAVAIRDCVKRIILEQGFFKHMLVLGYCCVQSLFILLHQVEWSPKPVQPKLLESVAFLRNVVIAVSKFYSQGQSWLETIRLVQYFQLDLVQLPGTTEDAFKGYLSRFKDVAEPLCVPLDPLVFCGAPHDTGPTDDTGSLYGEQSLEIPTAGKRTPSWMLDYTQHLTQYLSESEADQDAKSPSNPTSSVTLTYSELSSSTSGGVIQRQANPGAGNVRWLEETGLQQEQLFTEPDPVEGRTVRGSGSALEDPNVLLAQILQRSPNYNGFSIGETFMDTDAMGILQADLLFRNDGDLEFLKEHVPFIWDNTDNGILLE